MFKTPKFFRIVPLVLIPLILTSCAVSKKQKAAQSLSDTLRSSYKCEISFTVHGKENDYTGNASVSKNGPVTKLDIHSPDPYSGMSIEYNVSGYPESIALHFSGMDVTLPENALARINPLTSLFADDFASVVSKLPNEAVTEYEKDGKTAYCAVVPYANANVSLHFSDCGTVLYMMEYSSPDFSAELTFDSFKCEVINIGNE